MKIAYVIGGLHHGGIENWLLHFTPRLQTLGYEPVVINVTGKGELGPLFEQVGVSVYNVGRQGQRAGTHRFDTTYKLRRLIRRLQPHIIQSMTFPANYHTRLATLGMPVPVITNLRNTKCQTKFVRRMMDRILSIRTTVFVGVSQAVVRIAAGEQNLFKRPVHVIYNGIPDACFLAPAADISAWNLGDGPVLVAACRLTAAKNMDFFLDVFRNVLDRVPDVRFVLVGDGRDRVPLEAQAHALGITEHVLFTGMRSDVPSVLKALALYRSIFVVPSRWEGLCNAGLEAMACGIPLVVADTVPVEEVAGDAALVLPLDKQCWTDALIALLGDADRLEAMRTRGEAVAHQCDFAAHVSAWDELYRQIAGIM